MDVATLDDISRQIEQLSPEDKWALLAQLVASLRCHAKRPARRLEDYYGIGKGRGFQTAQQADAHLEEERASWEQRNCVLQ